MDVKDRTEHLERVVLCDLILEDRVNPGFARPFLFRGIKFDDSSAPGKKTAECKIQ
ncbi:MAG TPA: hypothetical protein VK452_03855 [Dissulfurispiraceae bacterium]|nr:hypothetical protein [Dissulfurispiraceae bacterium]